MITQTMRQYLAANPGLKYIFFGGKGGVGKTVLAGTAALWFAQAGRKTLLASTNPVHSLSSMLDRDVFGKPTDIPEVPNLQAYEIYAVSDPQVREALARAAYEQMFVAQAPVALVFCTHAGRARKYGERGSALYAIQDATIAAAYAQLAAVSVGLATCWVGAFDEAKAATALRLPSGERPIVILPLGRAAEQPERNARRTLEDLVHRV